MNPTDATSAPQLTPYQRDFVERFVREARPGSAHVLVAPVGLGKSFAVASAVDEMLRGLGVARVLVLCPAVLAAQWAFTLERAGAQAMVVDSRALRLMKEADRGPTEGFRRGASILSIDLAKRPDVRSVVVAAPWDVVVVDEAHGTQGLRRELVDALMARAPAPALLLVTGSPERLEGLAADAVVVDWTPAAVALYRTSVEKGMLRRHSVTYRRSPEEVALLHRVYDYANTVDGQAARGLFARAASSIRALEEGLMLLASREQPPGKAGALLQGIEQLETDVHLEQYRHLVKHLLAEETRLIVTFCEYRATASYLAAAVEGDDYVTSVLHQGQSRVEQEQAIVRLSSGRGVLVTTTAASRSASWGSVDAFIHYDLPMSPASFAERESRYRLFGRVNPCTAYLFDDESGALQLDGLLRKMVDKLDSIRVEVGFDFEAELRQIVGMSTPENAGLP